MGIQNLQAFVLSRGSLNQIHRSIKNQPRSQPKIHHILFSRLLFVTSKLPLAAVLWNVVPVSLLSFLPICWLVGCSPTGGGSQ